MAFRQHREGEDREAGVQWESSNKLDGRFLSSRNVNELQNCILGLVHSSRMLTVTKTLPLCVSDLSHAATVLGDHFNCASSRSPGTQYKLSLSRGGSSSIYYFWYSYSCRTQRSGLITNPLQTFACLTQTVRPASHASRRSMPFFLHKQEMTLSLHAIRVNYHLGSSPP